MTFYVVYQQTNKQNQQKKKPNNYTGVVNLRFV